MRVFVTGATGHLGANLVRMLRSEGQDVRVLVREGSDRRSLEGLGVEYAVGDLSDAERLQAAMRGCEQLYHLAAFVSLRRCDRQRLYESNVLGTRHVLTAASRAGVAKVVHCSSFGALGTKPDGSTDASCVMSPFAEAFDYERSKVYAEMEVWRAAAAGLDVCIVNPSAMVGPWDYRPSLIGRTLLDFARGRLPVYVHGAYDFVPIRDVARAHLLAMQHGRRGERYVLSGELVELAQVLEWLSDILGRRRIRVGLSPNAVRPFVALKDRVEEHLLPHRHPRFNSQTLSLLSSRKHGDRSETERVLGWRPGPVRDALQAHLAWMRDHLHVELPSFTLPEDHREPSLW